MSDVKRYDVLGDSDGGYIDQAKDGRVVLYTDYAALEAECERLRDVARKEIEAASAQSREVAGARMTLIDLTAQRDAALRQVDALRQALTKIHDRCEAFVGDDSGMQVHSVEVLMDIAARGLSATL